MQEGPLTQVHANFVTGVRLERMMMMMMMMTMMTMMMTMTMTMMMVMMMMVVALIVIVAQTGLAQVLGDAPKT